MNVEQTIDNLLKEEKIQIVLKKQFSTFDLYPSGSDVKVRDSFGRTYFMGVEGLRKLVEDEYTYVKEITSKNPEGIQKHYVYTPSRHGFKKKVMD
ncbi:MAG: hypothetical protein GOU97_04650 [Nanoarchaeota archaeon]|nr:hypothetical protein [Nanoarchaeota archaeon]